MKAQMQFEDIRNTKGLGDGYKYSFPSADLLMDNQESNIYKQLPVLYKLTGEEAVN